jgi:2-dehydro-3-deoxyphosphogalactonate aldolase
MQFDEALAALPLIAILRGLEPQEAIEVASVLYDAGFRIVEVPLNSPSPLDSIARIVTHFGARLVVGAGTVVEIGSVAELARAGAHLVVSPNFAEGVVRATKAKGLISIPGVATPSEAFAALAAGADALKLFPAEMMTPAVLRSLCAVLPKSVKLIPVGGITASNLAAYREAGAHAFGIGSALFKPGKSPAEIATSAAAFAAAMRNAGA